MHRIGQRRSVGGSIAACPVLRALVLLAVASCSGGSTTSTSSADGGPGSPSATSPTPATAADCTSACKKLVACKLPNMPATEQECTDGCQGALSEPSTGAMLACIGKTSACDAVSACITSPSGTADVAYVAPAGDDAQAGTSASQPKKTIAAGAAAVKNGGTVRIASGTFAECLLLSKSIVLEGGYDAAFARRDTKGAPTVIDGGGKCQVMTLGGPGAGTARLDGLVIQNGDSSSSTYGKAGGCIAFSNYEATLNDVIVQRCKSPEDAGGIEINQTKLTMTNSQVLDCQGTKAAGGGIHFNKSTFALTGCVFARNSGVNWGGGINLYESEGSVDGCTFDSNTALQSGGGINVTMATAPGQTDAKLSVKGSKFTGNEPNGISGKFADLGGNTLQ